ncbi:MAG: hypothetical protein ACXVCY_11870 [Pseudobdellovibrionaceae bacterium]
MIKENLIIIIVVNAIAWILFTFYISKTQLKYKIEVCALLNSEYNETTKTCRGLVSTGIKDNNTAQNVPGNKTVLCENGKILQGIAANGEPICGANIQGVNDEGIFVGGLIQQEVCRFKNGEPDENCKSKSLTVSECTKDLRPFVIRAGVVDYLLPNLCLKKNFRCYVDNTFEGIKRRAFLLCDDYKIFGFANAKK